MRRYAPVIVLFVLSPLVAEVLFGATPISNLRSLMVVAPLYGGGAVFIRELARRRGPGWGRIALLGAAYGILEEGLALESMFNPDLFNAGVVGGRALGVNWIWSEWTIGYHVVWSVSIPILVAELLFPARRTEPWLRRAGVACAGALFALGTLALAAIFRWFVAPHFRAPAVLAAGAALVVVALVALALGWPAAPEVTKPAARGSAAPSPWFVGLVAFLAGTAWFNLLFLPHALRTGALALVPLLLGVVVAAGLAALLRRWSSAGSAWTYLHELALVLGGLLPSMLFGFFFVTAGNRVDQAGQGVASVVALLLLALFALHLRKRAHAATSSRQVLSDSMGV